jgi:hypothetical protein
MVVFLLSDAVFVLDDLLFLTPNSTIVILLIKSRKLLAITSAKTPAKLNSIIYSNTVLMIVASGRIPTQYGVNRLNNFFTVGN